MRAAPAAFLGSVHGQVPALEKVRADVTVNDLMVEAEMTQRYRNLESTNIEAVYTFPLPLDAVLLGFDVEIAERKLAGTVVEKTASERRYEEAIVDGEVGNRRRRLGTWRQERRTVHWQWQAAA